MKDFSISIDKLCISLETNIKTGLNSNQAEIKLKLFGSNHIAVEKKPTLLIRFFSQFKDTMILILLLATLISFYVAILDKDAAAFLEPALILLIVVIDALLGVYQERKAEKNIDELQEMLSNKAIVIRDGYEQIIVTDMLVPGDVVKLVEGDIVPADGRLIETSSLIIEESPLTGVSEPVEKNAKVILPEDTALCDRKNMVYSGCCVLYGNGLMLVTSTGMNTEMGSIVYNIRSDNKSSTQLQRRVRSLGKKVGFLAIAICSIIFTIGYFNGMPIIKIFMVSVSLAVAAIPEGLPAIVTIILSVGVIRLAKQNAVIKNLPAAETLGCASVICSNKTGTLTQNRMTLMQAYSAKDDIVENISDHNNTAIKDVLLISTLCCNGDIDNDCGNPNYIGSSTETCIVYAAMKNGLEKKDLAYRYPRIAEFPFNVERKLMSVICSINGKLTLITKGGYDIIRSKCKKGGNEKASAVVDDMESNAFRVLAVAYRVLEQIPTVIDLSELEHELTLVGVLGMMDPPRREAKDAVDMCLRWGVKPVMITGDHPGTARAIASQLGILSEKDTVITGTELSKLTDKQLEQKVNAVSVYASVSPKDKIRIVEAWQRRGAVVAVTGEGINDAPALRAADIGCAMGIAGTDVAKAASDMMLMDDNFETIITAIKEGRVIHENITKSVSFLLGTNIGELLDTLLSMALWQKVPFLSMQLLWINLITDSLPAISLGMEEKTHNVIATIPKQADKSLLSRELRIQIVFDGIMFALVTIASFQIGWQTTGQTLVGRTLAFITLSFAQVFHAFNMRSGLSLFKIGFFTNKHLNGSAAISFLLMCIVLFIPPITSAFGLVLLPFWMYAVGILFSVIPVFVIEAAKHYNLINSSKHS